jgi:hypothetical protein
MAAVENLISDAAEDDTDSLLLTRLANKLVNRLPMLAQLKTIYDGREKVPGQHVPKALRGLKSAEVYERNMAIASLNVSKPMVDSVTVRQRPNGFRLISDSSTRSTEADQMWRQCHMNIKARNLFHLRNLYGEAYMLVSEGHGSDLVTVGSPWECAMDSSHDSAITYQYDDEAKRDIITLYRLERDGDGNPSNVYYKIAYSESATRSILEESDDDSVYALANGETDKIYKFGNDFQWDGGARESLGYALANETLPLWRFSTADGKGLFEAHLASIYRIDQQIFDRVTITMMQAFIQRALKGFKRTTYKENDPAVVAGLKRAGDPIDMSEMFEQSPAALWLLPEGVDVWESKTVDITPLNGVITSDMKALADVAMTPLGINSSDVGGSASGADLKRESVIFKAEDLNDRADDGLVAVMKMALGISGSGNADANEFETLWLPIQPVQFEQPAQDASQLVTVLPRETIWTKVLGMNQQEVLEAQQQMDAQLLQDGASGADDSDAVSLSDASSSSAEQADQIVADDIASSQDGV